MSDYHRPHGYGALTPRRVCSMCNGENAVSTRLPDGRWVPSRPVPYHSLRERLIQAWHVLTYRADAFYWWFEDRKDGE